MAPRKRLILGSGSPRRLELLSQIGVTPDAVIPPDIDETPVRAEIPRRFCARIARDKVYAVQAAPEAVVLCADTCVALGRRILGKPRDEAQAEAFLHLMSGRRHQVITAVALRSGAQLWQKTVVSTVRMKHLSDTEVTSYLRSGDWKGKAGGYGIQGAASAFIPWISGSYTGIVGLPLAETAGLLQAAGYPVFAPLANPEEAT